MTLANSGQLRLSRSGRRGIGPAGGVGTDATGGAWGKTHPGTSRIATKSRGRGVMAFTESGTT